MVFMLVFYIGTSLHVAFFVLMANHLTWDRGYKTFFMLNSVEHEIISAHKYKNIKKVGFNSAQISLECYLFRS